ncbi:MAG: hypothetical protein ACKKMS_03245 [Candidatus Nealsonbacteria bacterium]
MFLSLPKLKILKKTNIFWIIFLSIIFLFAIGYQIKAVSGMTHLRHDGREVHIGAGDNIQSYSWTRPSDATYVVVNVYWKWKGRKCQFQSNETHRVETPLGSVDCRDFGNEELLFGSISCPTSDKAIYSGPERLCGTLQGNFSGSSFNVTVRAVGGGSHFSVVRADWYKPAPTITCWSCNTSSYTCSFHTYTGTSCPSGTYSSLSSCQNVCQQPTITCWSCNTYNHTCSSQSYTGTYCPSGTYSSSSSCQNACQQSTITCWSCNTYNHTCSSQSYSGYYCPSGTYSSRSSCEDVCEEPQIKCWYCSNDNCYSRTYSGYYCPSGTYSSRSSCEDVCEIPPSPVLNVSKTVRNITDNTTFQNSVSADPLERLEFKIRVSSTGSTRVQSVTVKDSLPLHITYQNNLKINGISSSGNILTGLNLGTVYPGQSKIIIFEAKVASENQFIYGTTTLTNTAIAYSANSEDTDTAKVIVTRKAVAGAVTEVKTGIVSRALDYVLFPLIMTFIIILVFKNYLIFLNEWLEKGKNRMIEHRANRSLRKIISRIKTRERF